MDFFIRFLILVLLGLVLVRSAQTSLNADDLLNQLEASLLELVKQVQANDLNSCESLSTCNADSTCSRLTCPLTSTNTAGYECQEVLQNTYCKDNCPRRNFDFSTSFLSVPGVKDVRDEYITQRQLREICAQRNLDRLFFQKHSNNTNFFSLYFGSVTGTFRFFPGMEESDCGRYDPRTRLWYLASTSNVKKAVMVLIDRGSSMTETIPSTTSNNLAAAFGMTKSFLNTAMVADYVNIFTFDKNNVNFSSPQPVLVTDTSTHPEFRVFNETLSTPNQSSVPSGNITHAISNVITSSEGFGYTEIPIEYLKVIILITDSNEQAVDAINSAALPWDLITNNSINVFLYMIPTSNAVIDVSPLASQLCAARGYFKILDFNNTDISNPLLVLEAYYSFVANVQSTYVNNGIHYSIEYSDYSDVDNQTFTLSKAVFSTSNGEFLGVVAINIFKTEVQEVYKIDEKTIELVVRKRMISRLKNFNASTRVNTTTCLNQASNQPCNQTANISNIVCSSNFDADITILQNLSCCGTCTGVTMPPVSTPATAEKPRNLHLVLGLGLGLGIPTLLLVTVALIIAWLFKRRQHRLDEFSGTSGEDEDLR